MKEKLQNFYKKYRKPIIITGCLVGTGVVVYLASKYTFFAKKEYMDLRGKSIITWDPSTGTGTMNLDKVKEILEANKDNSSCFAIFREGPAPNEYIAIALDDTVNMV